MKFNPTSYLYRQQLIHNDERTYVVMYVTKDLIKLKVCIKINSYTLVRIHLCVSLATRDLAKPEILVNISANLVLGMTLNDNQQSYLCSLF